MSVCSASLRACVCGCVCAAHINCALGTGQRARGKGKGSRAAYRLQQLVVAVATSAIASDPLILFGVKGLGCATPTAEVCGQRGEGGKKGSGGCRASSSHWLERVLGNIFN